MGIESLAQRPVETEHVGLERTEAGFPNPDHLKPIESGESLLDRIESKLSDPSALSRPVEGLSETRQKTEVLDDGSTVYNTPFTTGLGLNHCQGRAVEGMGGTCALVSAENVCRLAGKDITEADVIHVATQLGLCEIGNDDSSCNGGVAPWDLPKVLEALGVKTCELWPNCHEDVACAIESGRGVIAPVDVGVFWDGCADAGLHAVTLTSVERDPDGRVSAFYVCDSGTGGSDFARRVEANHFASAHVDCLPLTVTDRPIR